MPREQIQRLSKRPSVETQAGQYGTGRTGVVNMPFVHQDAGSGQQLAKALGMAVETTGKIVQIENQKDQKKKSIFDNLQGDMAGTSKANEVLEQAKELPLEQRNKYVETEMMNWMNSYKDSNTTDAWLRGALTSFTARTTGFENENYKALEKQRKNDLMTSTVNSIRTDVFAGNSHSSIMDKIKVVNNIGNAEAGKVYVESVSALIKEAAQLDPNYDWQASIDSLLKIQTKEGQVYSTHPTYGKMIDALESSLTTLSTQRAAKLKENIKQANIETTNTTLLTLNNADLKPEEISDIESNLPEMAKTLSVTQFSKILTAIEDEKDVTGHASTSNPELYSRLQREASNNKLDYTSLRTYKDKLTKDEFKSLNTVIINTESSLKDTTHANRLSSYNDAEKNGVDMVAPSGLAGFLDPTSGPKKAFMFKQQLNEWKEKYFQENGMLPSGAESFIEANRITDEVNKAFTGTGKSSNITLVENAMKDGSLQKRITQGIINQSMINEYNTWKAQGK